jgi:DNA-3-methyladenine glycosylase I
MPTGEGAPPRITPKSLDDYLEIQTKAVFQSRMSWKVVEAKWPTTREALDEFQVAAIASYGPERLAELGDDARVIRNKRKLAAITDNARKMIELDEQ